jgi:hypothetical protein
MSKRSVSIFVFLCLLLCLPGRGLIGPAQVPDLKPQPAGNPSGLHLDFGSLPLYFTTNRGQVDGRALFYAKAARYTLWLTEEGLVFDSFKSEHAEAPAADKESSPRPEKREARGYERDVSRLVFLNASKHPQIVPVDETALRVNYFIGNVPAKWHAAVPTSAAVLYKNIYDRIDLKVYGIESRIEYDWIVRPGGDPQDIRFQYENVKGTRVDEGGNLLIETGFGELVHKKPVAYQEAGGKRPVEERSGKGTRVAVESAFKKITDNAYGFEVGAYEAGLELVIDPVVLAYSTYLGGNGDDYGYGIAVDGSGNAYVTGVTGSTDFPTLNQYQTNQAGNDAFVTKIDTTKSGNASLVYSTYLGGNGDDYGYGIAVDGSGNAYVTGSTTSTDFPTLNQYQTNQAGNDAFVTKIDTTKSGNASLIYSTYLGGSNGDAGYGIAVDGSGNAYVTGSTTSTDFPALNQYQTNQAGDDAFVTKIDSTKSGLASLLYSTYLGGSGNDDGRGIAVDGSGNAYVTGYTLSTDFPCLSQYQTDPWDGTYDVFVTKIDMTKSGNASLLYSTYLGGSRDDYGCGIAVNGSGNAYVTGYTNSADFPILNQYQTDQTDYDVFVIKIDTTKSGNAGLVYSTYLGGSGNDYGSGIAADGSGNAYVTGYTSSTGFPTRNQYQTDPGDGAHDAFVTKIDTTKSGNAGLVYSTYLGGNDDDRGYGIAVDDSGNAYVTGETTSSDFPTLNQYQTDQTGVDAFITKISADYTISGTITSSGNPLANVVLNGLPGNPQTNAQGQYTALAISGWTGTATPTLAGYAFIPPSRNYTNIASDKTNQNYTASLILTYTISGTVAEGTRAIQGASVAFSYDGHVEETDINGRYAYAVPPGTTTTVTPSHSSYSAWTPPNRTIANITADQPNQDFQGTPKTYRISGRVTDGTNPVAGVTITFSFYGHTETTAADGTYSYNMPPNSSTLITPGKTGYSSWTPAVRELTNITSDQPNQDFQGTNLSAPKMTLVQGQTTIPKGGTYDYGTQFLNAGTQAVFTINNTGGSDLTLQTNLVINGANADQFRIVQAPTSPVAPNESTTFIIEFKATSGGQKTASIPLVNNDPANNPYDLNLAGKGKTSLAFGYSGSWTAADHGGEPWYIGDFNGDGKTDIFRYWGASGADMFLSNGAQFVSSGSWTPAGHGLDGWYVGDFNGDGKTDIFRYWGSSGADMFLSNGAQFVSSGSWTPAGHGTDGWYIGDFNGDGRSDICRVMPGSTDVFLSTGASFLYAGSWTTTVPGPDGWYVGDFNGDGKSDLCRVMPGATEVFLSTGTSFVSAGSWTTSDPGEDGWYVGDFNGDGKTDIFRYGGASGADVFLSDGSAFVYSGSWTPAGHGPEPWYIGNFDGTGGDDIFRSLPGVSGADVFLSNSALPTSVSELEPDHPVLDEPLPPGTYRELSYAEETGLLAPFIAKTLRGEEVSIFEIKKAYEEALGRRVRKAAVNQLLSRHDFWKIIKGRAFGSPLARGLYARASTAEVDPQTKPGAPAAVGRFGLLIKTRR